jgi:hypothetical protein
MKKRSLIRGWLVLASAILVLAAGAVIAAVAAGTPAAAVTLEYKMPAGKVLRYEAKEDGREIMDLMGQVVETTTNTTSTFSFTSQGLKDGNFLLGVTIEDMAISISSMMGDMSPDMTPVSGKTFDMIVSRLGIEIDASGAEAITYESPNGTRNLASGFKIFFPDLPGKPVKAGDTWPSTFVIEEKSDAMDIRVDVQSLNTLEGFETVDGMECARIVSKQTGVLTGTGYQQGVEIQLNGTLAGTDTWHFASKEGLYLKSKSDSTSELTISAQGMTIPATATRVGEIKLLGK